jgi:uncharacterized lipoprotein
VADRYNFHPPRRPRPCAVLDRIGAALDRADLTITAVDAERGTVTVESARLVSSEPNEYGGWDESYMYITADFDPGGWSRKRDARRVRMARKKRKGWA